MNKSEILELMYYDLRRNWSPATYDRFRDWCWSHQDVVIAALTTETTDIEIVRSILTIMGHGGSVLLRHNRHMIPFMNKLCRKWDELNHETQHYMKWLVEVHNYPLDIPKGAENA